MSELRSRCVVDGDGAWRRHQVWEIGDPDDDTSPGLWCVRCGEYVACPSEAEVFV